MSSAATLARRIVANDLRVFLRSWQRRRARRSAALALQVLFLALVHLPAFVMLMPYAGRPRVPGGAELACLTVLLFVLMAGFQRSLEVLYNRGDLPFLLASPVPARVVVFTRLADIVVTTWLSTALLGVPLLDTAVYLYGPRWLWGWAVWLLAVGVLAPLSLLLCVLLVKRIGARRARTMVQVFGVLFGGVVFLALQAPNWTSHHPGGHRAGPAEPGFLARFDVPPLRQVADATAGDLPWLGVLAACAAAMAALAFWKLAREFTLGAQAAAGESGAPTNLRASAAAARRAWRGAFNRSRWSALVRTQFRLVFRDPLLLARSAMQLVSFVPALVGVLWFHTAAGVAGFALVAPSVVAAMLAALMTANDDAAEFVAASPGAGKRTAVARAVAAAFPPAVLGWLLAAVVVFVGEPVMAAMAAVGATLNTASLAWVGACTARPPSAEDRARNKPPKMVWHSLLAMLLGGLGVAAVGTRAAQLPLVPEVFFWSATGFALLLFLVRPKPVWAGEENR